jgi:hypothetical protein
MSTRKVGDRCAAQTGSVRYADSGCRGRVVVRMARYRPAKGPVQNKLSLCCDRVGHAWGTPTEADLIASGHAPAAPRESVR